MRLKSIILPTTLALSLVLNGAAVGYLYSQWSKSHARQERAEQYLQTKKPAFFEGISEDKRKVYLDTRNESSKVLKQEFTKLLSLRGELFALLSAEDFSEDAYRNKLEEVIAVQGKIQRLRMEPALKLSESLTPEERKKLVEMLKSSNGRARQVK